MYYEMALNDGDFYWIADMLAQGSSAYKELENYVNDIANNGHYFYFTNNEVLDVKSSNGKYYIEMNETFLTFMMLRETMSTMIAIKLIPLS